MSVEYIFFDTELRDRFVQFLSVKGLACQTRDDVMEGFIVEIPDEPSDEMLDAVEAQYEALMDEQMAQAGSHPDWVKHEAAGVGITRLDGSACTVRLPAHLARSLIEHFTPDEIQALVTAIAHGLDNPINAPLCCEDEAALAARRG